MKITVEISAEELRQSRERALHPHTGRRLSVVEWVARDLAHDIAGRYARSQKVSWALTDIFRPIILAQLTGLDEKELNLLHTSPDDNVMPQKICDRIGVPQGSTFKEGREMLQ